MPLIVTDRVTWSVSVWVVDSGGPKEPCIRWVSILPRVKGQFIGGKGTPTDLSPLAMANALVHHRRCVALLPVGNECIHRQDG